MLYLSKHKVREIKIIYIVAIRESKLIAIRRLATSITIIITSTYKGASNIRTNLSSLRIS